MVKKAEGYGYKAYRLHEGKWKEFDSSYFIDSICTDYLFVHPRCSKCVFPVSKNKFPKRSEEENIELANDVLNRFLIRQNDGGQIIEWTTAICNSLREFPALVTPEIRNLLLEVYKVSKNSVQPVEKALSWLKLNE